MYLQLNRAEFNKIRTASYLYGLLSIDEPYKNDHSTTIAIEITNWHECVPTSRQMREANNDFHCMRPSEYMIYLHARDQ